jgi:hypothetical protein
VFSRQLPDSLQELWLSSSEGCRKELLLTSEINIGPAFSYNNGRGLVVWVEGFDAYELIALRFSYDDVEDRIDTGSPQSLATAGPSEYFFDVDTWANYDPTATQELVSLIKLNSDLLTLELIDLADCNANSCSAQELIGLNDAEQEACIDGAATFDSTPEDYPECFKTSAARFSPAGDALIAGAEAPGWISVLRTLFSRGQTGWEALSVEMVAVDRISDCERASLTTFAGAVTSISGREIYAFSSCEGFQQGAGLRDQRLYFLDVQACRENPRNWQGCLSTDLQSGDINGTNPSWFPNGEILYGGFTDTTLDSLRVFDPILSRPMNDRTVVSDASLGDAGL